MILLLLLLRKVPPTTVIEDIYESINKLEKEVNTLEAVVKKDNATIEILKKAHEDKYLEHIQKKKNLTSEMDNTTEYQTIIWQQVKNQRDKSRLQYETAVLENLDKLSTLKSKLANLEVENQIITTKYKKMTSDLNAKMTEEKDLRKAEKAHNKRVMKDLDAEYSLLESKVEEYESLKDALLKRYGGGNPEPEPEEPEISSLPAILPAEGKAFDKQVQYPHYCCTCKFLSKIAVNGDDQINDEQRCLRENNLNKENNDLNEDDKSGKKKNKAKKNRKGRKTKKKEALSIEEKALYRALCKLLA